MFLIIFFCTLTHTHRHLLCRAGLCVAEMVAQYWFGGEITHSGVDLNLLVLQTDRFGGDTTYGKRHREAGVRRDESGTFYLIINTHTHTINTWLAGVYNDL